MKGGGVVVLEIDFPIDHMSYSFSILSRRIKAVVHLPSTDGINILNSIIEPIHRTAYIALLSLTYSHSILDQARDFKPPCHSPLKLQSPSYIHHGNLHFLCQIVDLLPSTSQINVSDRSHSLLATPYVLLGSARHTALSESFTVLPLLRHCNFRVTQRSSFHPTYSTKKKNNRRKLPVSPTSPDETSLAPSPPLTTPPPPPPS